MMFQLEEERKVTANLSRTLELEKRKVTIFFCNRRQISARWIVLSKEPSAADQDGNGDDDDDNGFDDDECADDGLCKGGEP